MAALKVLVGRPLHEPGGFGDNDAHTLDPVVLHAFAVPALRGGLSIAGGVCRADAQLMLAWRDRIPLEGPWAPRIFGETVAQRRGIPSEPAVHAHLHLRDLAIPRPRSAGQRLSRRREKSEPRREVRDC